MLLCFSTVRSPQQSSRKTPGQGLNVRAGRPLGPILAPTVQEPRKGGSDERGKGAAYLQQVGLVAFGKRPMQSLEHTRGGDEPGQVDFFDILTLQVLMQIGVGKPVKRGFLHNLSHAGRPGHK